MSDTIYRQDAIDAVRHAWAKGLEPTQFLEDLPSAQPEIVRCKNCKNFRRNIPCVGGVYDGCGELLDEGNEMPVEESFYCGYAERREE